MIALPLAAILTPGDFSPHLAHPLLFHTKTASQVAEITQLIFGRTLRGRPPYRKHQRRVRAVTTKLDESEFNLFNARCQEYGVSPAEMVRQALEHYVLNSLRHPVTIDLSDEQYAAMMEIAQRPAARIEIGRQYREIIPTLVIYAVDDYIEEELSKRDD